MFGPYVHQFDPILFDINGVHLLAENERLPRARGRTVSLKISEKGGVSVSGPRSLSRDAL